MAFLEGGCSVTVTSVLAAVEVTTAIPLASAAGVVWADSTTVAVEFTSTSSLARWPDPQHSESRVFISRGTACSVTRGGP
jgi:H+/Cl- antiporter ClcA